MLAREQKNVCGTELSFDGLLRGSSLGLPYTSAILSIPRLVVKPNGVFRVLFPP